ncbi:unnamed protein product [Pleuronectes platessa]|uniref:Uncharacterized protein n=1 Tax=Pleuronectes platessa TaxID=8262 RepID=A0A9N7Z3X0_PLEPL|nr:unnamed protein product [Pleuronectes platessa]
MPVGPEPSGVPADTGAERNKGLLNFGRENILLQAQESPPGGGEIRPLQKREIHSAEEHELHIPEEETMFHPVEEQDESVPIRPSRRRCNQGTSATELERPRSFTGLLENPRATRKQHREGHTSSWMELLPPWQPLRRCEGNSFLQDFGLVKKTCSLAKEMREAQCHMARSWLSEECQTTVGSLGGGSCLPVTQGTKVPPDVQALSSQV